ncbi:transmembrane protein [Rhizoclosmatium globosum]|uniref:Magnesium-transporting ATPase, P-type 1 n=1 Tax=Rhizoclosmatium globosum TaxID=329046 RepID=A0A1Y2CG15_9FUNG|nr:transmembrane protein [Rhizoclosmatium globosum]|eukprot:ORY45857.1 transmembrane protein [Rhizoclosmatium globosum]
MSSKSLTLSLKPASAFDAHESQTSKPVSFAQRLKRTFSPAERKRLEEVALRNEAIDMLVNCASFDTDALLARLFTDRQGLTSEWAAERLIKYGPNIIHATKPPAWYTLLLLAATHPFQILLIILACSNVVIPGNVNWPPFVYLMLMFLFATVSRFVQEMKSTSAAQTLLALYKTHVIAFRRVLKDSLSVPCKLERSAVVPGDVIQLTAGTVFPGDCIIISANDLMVGESSLTGESIPVQKTAGAVNNSGGIFDCTNIGLMGTNVQSGVGVAVVVNTGDRTFISGVASELSKKGSRTAYDRGVHQVTYLLLGITVTLVTAIVLIDIYYGKQDPSSAFEFGVATACGVLPEMLPMVINGNLIKGSLELVKHRAIVKQISSIQNVGAMEVLCSDKTGTLTKDEVVLIRSVNADGNVSMAPLSLGFINSCLQEGLKNILDEAIIDAAAEGFADFGVVNGVVDAYQCIAEIPFDFERRCVSVVVEKGSTSEDSGDTMVANSVSRETIMVCKGAVEEILTHSTSFIDNNGLACALTQEKLSEITEMIHEMNNDGLRVLGVATRTFAIPKAGYSKVDENDMTFQGCLAFLDPPKETSVEAIQQLRDLAVEVKVLTGDNLNVSVKICRDVGIPVTHVYSGNQLESMSEKEFENAVEVGTVFAKLSPVQKRQIVEHLQSKGKVVGFLGDGINDALALKCADVGISVDMATEVAKDAADIILLEKSLLILSHAVRTGRIVYGNTVKYIKMATSSNFGNCFSNVVAALWFPSFQPISAIMILTNNMLYDISQTTMPWDSVDESFLEIPRKWDIIDLLMFIVSIGPLSSLFDASTFAINLNYWGWNDGVDTLGFFQTSWFIESLLTQTIIVHLLRTEKIPFIQSAASWQVLLGTGLTCVAGMVLPFTPMGSLLGMAVIPAIQYGFIFMNIFLYVCVVLGGKAIYIRVRGRWL